MMKSDEMTPPPLNRQKRRAQSKKRCSVKAPQRKTPSKKG